MVPIHQVLPESCVRGFLEEVVKDDLHAYITHSKSQTRPLGSCKGLNSRGHTRDLCY
jgi:hypothetical protein